MLNNSKNGCNYNKCPKREKHSQHQFKKRAGFKDEHHLKPSERGGESILSNLLILDAYRHDAWHLLFHNLTLDEIINLLIRVKVEKESQKTRLKI